MTALTAGQVAISSATQTTIDGSKATEAVTALKAVSDRFVTSGLFGYHQEEQMIHIIIED